jgi:hypothetical protein
MQRVVLFAWANLGHCPRCVRKALLASFVVWVIFALAFTFADPLVASLVAVLAMALSFLWVAHLLAFAVKSKGALPANQLANPERRSAFPLFARAIGAGIAMSVALPQLGSAQTTVTCPSNRCACGSGNNWQCLDNSQHRSCYCVCSPGLCH